MQAGQPCNWEIVYWGGGWLYGVNPVPVGDQHFLTGAGANFGSYCDPTNDANIHGDHAAGRHSGRSIKYQNYLAKQLPVLWMPYRPYQLSMIEEASRA